MNTSIIVFPTFFFFSIDILFVYFRSPYFLLGDFPTYPHPHTLHPSAQRELGKMDERAKVPVSLPVTDPNPTTSYWQDPPDEEIGADYRSEKELPSEVDTVIIGSGITGAAVGWGLLSRKEAGAGKGLMGESKRGGDVGGGSGGGEKKEKRWEVVMLEARRAVSGATGRNGMYFDFISFWHSFFLKKKKKICCKGWWFRYLSGFWLGSLGFIPFSLNPPTCSVFFLSR